MEGMNDDSKSVAGFMKGIFEEYQLHLRRKPLAAKDVEQTSFWDCVVLTAYDSQQKRGFEEQLNIFAQQDRLPPGTSVQVIADPDSSKLGSGGSTLHCLLELRRSMGDVWLRSAKILIIHSGGSSQRLPSYSAQGKIFAPIPIPDLVGDGEVPLMLDLKLALYLPLCRLLSAGVLVTGADHIETYILPEGWPSKPEMELLLSSDVIALAHPSDVRTGEGHGVYVLDPRPSTTADVRVQSVLEVLQKPSRALMQAKGAIVKREISVGGPVEEMVYSDSVFWLSHRVYDSLLSWYEDNTPLQEEFDAYAHLLPAFGDRIQDSKNENVRKHAESVSDLDKKVEGAIVDFEDDAKLTKRPRLVNEAGERSVQLCKASHEFLIDMKSIMKNRSLKVIVLERSKFHHLGSMREYVDNLTSSRSLKQELGLQNIMKCNLKKFWNTDHEQNLVIMGCFVGDSVKCDIASDRRAVLEWSLIDVPIVIENDVLLSNCDIRLDPAVQMLQTDIKIKIFENVVMHTVPIKVNNSIMYVTCVLNINDDIKFSAHELNKISYFGCDMSSVIRILGYDEKQVLANEKKFSLWNLRLFPSATTANVSFWKSYSMINRLLNKTCGTTELTKVHFNAEKLYSLKDLSEAKDLDTLLNDRHKLLIKIGTNLQAML